jgi:hypothetical protein
VAPDEIALLPRGNLNPAGIVSRAHTAVPPLRLPGHPPGDDDEENSTEATALDTAAAPTAASPFEKVHLLTPASDDSDDQQQVK